MIKLNKNKNKNNVLFLFKNRLGPLSISTSVLYTKVSVMTSSDGRGQELNPSTMT